MKEKVFVYGTLKGGYHNNYILGESAHIGEALTLNQYVLTNCGFPYLIDNASERGVEAPQAPVRGEVYEVTQSDVMSSLDALEGVSYGHYRRERIKVSLKGEIHEVWAYIAETDTAHKYSLCELEEGNYVWG